MPIEACCPLVLVSQVQRSGGSLMAQLFDGHPELFAHPAELHIGHPRKWDWPDLDLAAGPEAWIETLHEEGLARYFKRGLAKASRNVHARKDKRPYRFSLPVQRRVFLDACTAKRPLTQRQVLDCYFTSYFGAWEDCAPSGRERFVTAFLPRLVMEDASAERYLRDYPDGRIVSIVRDPRTWYLSSHRHNADGYPYPAAAIPFWRRSTEAILALSERLEGRHLFFTYEALVGDPPAVMRRVAAWLGIEYLDILTVPTYLGSPVRPNSSFAVDSFGVNRLSLERVDLLEPAERAYIERESMPLYREAERRSPL